MTILDELKVITLDENAATVSLTELRAGRAMVLDMWTTKCVKCPAALSKLNDEAEECASSSTAPLFVSCALSQGAGNRELVVDMVEGEYEALTHVFMELEQKEAAKAAFGFSAVPFLLVVSKSGQLLGAGDPKTTDHAALLSAAEAQEKAALACPTAPAPAAAKSESVFTLDEDF